MFISCMRNAVYLEIKGPNTIGSLKNDIYQKIRFEGT